MKKYLFPEIFGMFCSLGWGVERVPLYLEGMPPGKMIGQSSPLMKCHLSWDFQVWILAGIIIQDDTKWQDQRRVAKPDVHIAGSQDVFQCSGLEGLFCALILASRGVGRNVSVHSVWGWSVVKLTTWQAGRQACMCMWKPWLVGGLFFLIFFI